jgi:hypothetical protein
MRSKKGSLAEIQNQLAHQSVFFPIVLNRRRSQGCAKLLTNEGNDNDIPQPLGACNFHGGCLNWRASSVMSNRKYDVCCWRVCDVVRRVMASDEPIKADLAAGLIEAA